MNDVKWIDGAPEKLEPGMLVMCQGKAILIGHSDPCCRYGLVEFGHIDEVLKSVAAWAWLIQPHELEWVERMAKAHGVAK